MIKRILSVLTALLLLTAQVEIAAASDWMMNSYRFAVAGPSPPAISFLQCSAQVTGSSPYTVAAQNVGTASSDRKTIIGVIGEDNSSSWSFTGLTVGGDAATEITDNGGAQVSNASIWIVDNPVGTSEDIVITTSEALADGLSVCIWQATGTIATLASANSAGVNGNLISANLSSTSTDGFAVGVCVSSNSSTDTTTWAGLTERHDSDVGGYNQSAADTGTTPTSGGSLNISCDYAGSAGAQTIATASFGTPPIISYVTNAFDATDATNYSFSSVSFGAPATDRLIAIVVMGRSSRTVSSATIGGVSASVISGTECVEGTGSTSQIIIAAVPTGTTGTVTINWSGSNIRTGIVVYRLTGVSATATDTAQDPAGSSDPSLSIDIPAGGGAFMAAWIQSNTSTTWTGMTEDVDSVLWTDSGSAIMSAASRLTATALTAVTVTADFASSGTGGSCASAAAFGP